MPSTGHHLVIAGASGVIGAAAVEHFDRLPGWTVTAVSRRRPVVAPDCRFEHLAVDLTQLAAAQAALDALAPVTHLLYAAVSEAPGLVAGWRDPDLIALNGAMFAHVLDPLAARGDLRHVCLLQGTKAYGAHHHPITIPAREDGPRDDHANFYWLHEDQARDAAARHGFGVTIFRPQVLLGAAPGAAMNPVAAIGAYAAICGERGLPMPCPGSGASVWELVDAGLLAEAVAWAFDQPQMAAQVYNITNGDVFVLRHAWPALADLCGLSGEGEPPGSLAAFFREPGSQAAWQRLAARHGLRLAALPELLGQGDAYLDLLTASRLTERPLPVLLSTIKLRHAGFAGCRDSQVSLLHWLRRMVALRLLPPLGRLTPS